MFLSCCAPVGDGDSTESHDRPAHLAVPALQAAHGLQTDFVQHVEGGQEPGQQKRDSGVCVGAGGCRCGGCQWVGVGGVGG